MKVLKKLKERDCKGCGNRFQPTRYFQVVCTATCAIKVAREKEEKKRKLEESKENKAWKVKKKELKEKLKTLSEYESEARKVFQKWIRMRDIADPCISCGRYADRYDGGHYFKAELFSGLIFNEDNCHKQCSRPCNKDLHGNESNYRIGLVKKIGEERVKWLEENKDRLRTYTYTKEEYLEIKRKYQAKLREL